VATTVQEQPVAIERPTPHGDVSPTARRHLRRNLALTVGEIICFAFGMALFDSSTVLASFIATLTGSAILLGLMPTVFQIGVGLPQLLAARFLANRQRKLPYIIWASFFRNLPLFLLFAATWASPSPAVLLATFFVCYGLFAIGIGAESVAWLDVFAKICPQELRGKVFAVGRTIGNLVSIGAGLLVARILAVDGDFPRNYALLFLGTALLMTAAMTVFGSIKEPVEPPAPVPASEIPQAPPDDRAVLVQGRRVWRDDAAFRRLTLARVAYVAHLVATPFYLRFARDELGIDDAAVGLFVSAMMVGQIAGNLAWGWLSARVGNRRVVQWSLLIAVALPPYVLLTPFLPQGAFLLVYVAMGAVLAGEMIGWMNMLLDVSPTARRPLYISLHSTLLLPANLLPLAGGVLLTVVPYGLFFPLIALTLLGSLWLVSQTGQRAVGRMG
jgi:MFS family permease